jgi:hypothetical protein
MFLDDMLTNSRSWTKSPVEGGNVWIGQNITASVGTPFFGIASASDTVSVPASASLN